MPLRRRRRSPRRYPSTDPGVRRRRSSARPCPTWWSERRAGMNRPSRRKCATCVATSAANSMPMWLCGSTRWSARPGMRVSLTAHRAVVVLVEVREELAGAHAQGAGDRAERAGARARRGRAARPARSARAARAAAAASASATRRARRGCRSAATRAARRCRRSDPRRTPSACGRRCAPPRLWPTKCTRRPRRGPAANSASARQICRRVAAAASDRRTCGRRSRARGAGAARAR